MSDDLQRKLRLLPGCNNVVLHARGACACDDYCEAAALALEDAASPEGLASFKEFVERHECKEPVDYFAAFVFWLRARAEEIRRRG